MDAASLARDLAAAQRTAATCAIQLRSVLGAAPAGSDLAPEVFAALAEVEALAAATAEAATLATSWARNAGAAGFAEVAAARATGEARAAEVLRDAKANAGRPHP